MRRVWVFAVVGALLAGVPLVAARGVAGAQVDGNTYTSPHYGYSLEWDEELWSVEEDDTPDDARDYLGLYTEVSALRLTGHEDNGGDPARCLEDRVASLESDPSVSDVELALDIDAPETGLAATDEAAVYAYTIETDAGDEEDLLAYFECRSLGAGDTLLEMSFISTSRFYEVDRPLVEDVLATLELPAPATPTAEDATPVADHATPRPGGDATPEASPELGETGSYTSPTYGYSLEWDTAIWEVDRERITPEGRDELVLDGVVPGPRLYVEGYEGYDGDPAACLEAASGEIGLEPGTDLEVLEDDDGELIQGEEADRAFAAYAFADPDGNAEQAYVECRELVPGESVLVFTFIAAADKYEAALERAQEVIDSLELAAQPSDATPEANGTEEGTPTARSPR